MNVLLCILITTLVQSTLIASDKLTQHASEQMFFEKVQRSSEQNLPTLVAQHPVLRAPHINADHCVLFTLLKKICNTCQPRVNLAQRIQKLLDAGVPLEQTAGHKRRTALMEVAGGGIICSAVRTDENPLKTLLDLKADPTLQDAQGRNALSQAIVACDDSNATIMAGHPTTASIINQYPYVKDSPSYLNAYINANPGFCAWREDTVKKFLKAGAYVAIKDIVDDVNRAPYRKKALLKKASVDQLRQVHSLINATPQASRHSLTMRLQVVDNAIIYVSTYTPLKKLFTRDIYKLIKGYEGGRFVSVSQA